MLNLNISPLRRTYLSKAHQQLNNLILTPKNGENRDFGPYSGQIPTFCQSYLLLERDKDLRNPDTCV